jgi:hypothetical protein
MLGLRQSSMRNPGVLLRVYLHLLFPVKDTFCGLAPPLSLISSSPRKVPVTERLGDHRTVMLQDCPAVRLEPQVLLDSENVLPLIVMPLMSNVVLAVLVIVVVLGGEQKQRLGGKNEMEQMKSRPAGSSFTTVPAPLSETVCGLAGALSLTESMPFTVSKALGVKVTVIVQLAPEARLVPWQLSVSAKAALALMVETLSAAVP